MKPCLLGFWKKNKSEQTLWTSPLQLMQMVKSADSFDIHQQNWRDWHSSLGVWSSGGGGSED